MAGAVAVAFLASAVAQSVVAGHGMGALSKRA